MGGEQETVADICTEMRNYGENFEDYANYANRIETAHKREMIEVVELRIERDRLKVDSANMRSALVHIETMAKGAPDFSPRTFKEIGRIAYVAIFNEINKEANDENAK